MPQFNVQDLETNDSAIEQLNTVLDFMNNQLDSTPKPNNWSLAPQNANQFILELKNEAQQIDNKLQNFITWCYIILFNTKKLHLTNQTHLLQLSKEKYQSNTLSDPQRRNIKTINIIEAALKMFSFIVYVLQISRKSEKIKATHLIALMITNYFVISYIRQELIKRYQLANKNTQEDKNNAFLTWLSKIADHIPTIQLKETSLTSALSNDNTPNLTPLYRRRLSEMDLTSQDKTLQTPAAGLKQKVQ